MTFCERIDEKHVRKLHIRPEISVASVYRIITNNLTMRKVAARWVPHHLNDEQKACRQRIAKELLHRYQMVGEEFLKRIVALDKTWIRGFEFELKSH